MMNRPAERKIGLYFGSFDPVHIGHLIIGQYFAEYTPLDMVWFVVSPQNPFKRQQQMLPGEDRLRMVDAAIANNPNLRSCDIELKLQKPSYTIDTLLALKNKYPKDTFALIMGSDNLLSLPQWKDYQRILEGYEIYAYPRPGHQVSVRGFLSGARIRMVDAPELDISSSFIRSAITTGKTPRYWLPDKVWEIIKKEGYYKE